MLSWKTSTFVVSEEVECHVQHPWRRCAIYTCLMPTTTRGRDCTPDERQQLGCLGISIPEVARFNPLAHIEIQEHIDEGGAIRARTRPEPPHDRGIRDRWKPTRSSKRQGWHLITPRSGSEVWRCRPDVREFVINSQVGVSWINSTSNLSLWERDWSSEWKGLINTSSRDKMGECPKGREL
jgi:hypothetical protein